LINDGHCEEALPVLIIGQWKYKGHCEEAMPVLILGRADEAIPPFNEEEDCFVGRKERSIHLNLWGDCFVASLLAMTATSSDVM
jgi:hypothetical protein